MASWEKNLDWGSIDPDVEPIEVDDDFEDDFEDAFNNMDLTIAPTHTHKAGPSFRSNVAANHFTLRDALIEHFFHMYMLNLVQWLT
jgi:hypothetical protein